MRADEMFTLKGKTALVTGGSRGIGLEIARGLGELGARVVIAARTTAQVESAAAELVAEGITTTGYTQDLSELEQLDAFVARIVAELGPIDVLVNNAAVSIVSPAETQSIADWKAVMDANLNSAFFLSQAVAAQCMIPRRSGKIINIASIGALGGTAIDSPYIASYSASKGAVISLTRALATEWGRFDINVNGSPPAIFPRR